MTVLKLILDTMKKTRGPQAVKGGTTRPLFETYTRYFRVNDEEQEKRS